MQESFRSDLDALGPSIKYVTLFWINFDPLPLPHFVTHPGTPQSTSHISDPPFLVSLVQKSRTKAPCTNSLSIVRGGFCPGVLSGGLLSGRFCPSGFCPFPLLSEYICYNRKVNITLNFMFHMYDNSFISVTSDALDPPPPLSQTVTLSQTPSPLERDVLYGRPLAQRAPLSRPEIYCRDLLDAEIYCRDLLTALRIMRFRILKSSIIATVFNELWKLCHAPNNRQRLSVKCVNCTLCPGAYSLSLETVGWRLRVIRMSSSSAT